MATMPPIAQPPVGPQMGQPVTPASPLPMPPAAGPTPPSPSPVPPAVPAAAAPVSPHVPMPPPPAAGPTPPLPPTQPPDPGPGAGTGAPRLPGAPPQTPGQGNAPKTTAQEGAAMAQEARGTGNMFIDGTHHGPQGLGAILGVLGQFWKDVLKPLGLFIWDKIRKGVSWLSGKFSKNSEARPTPTTLPAANLVGGVGGGPPVGPAVLQAATPEPGGADVAPDPAANPAPTPRPDPAPHAASPPDSRISPGRR